MDKPFSINAVAFQEGDVWIVQGIEYNLVARAHSVHDIAKAFVNLVVERFHVAGHLGLDPFKGVGSAPERFRSMFDAAQSELRLAQPVEGAQATVRLAEAA